MRSFDPLLDINAVKFLSLRDLKQESGQSSRKEAFFIPQEKVVYILPSSVLLYLLFTAFPITYL